MKKSVLLLIPAMLVTSFHLTSCGNKNQTNSPLVISEYLEGSSQNKAIELYNISNKEVDLSKYKLEIFLSEAKQDIVTLEGKVAPGETFVIVNNGSDADLLAKADLKTKLMYIGKQPISLKRGSKTLDIVGVANSNVVEFGKDICLVRKTNYMVPRKTFDEYDWIRYLPNEYQYLNNIDNSVTEEELLAGPRLTSEDLEKEYGKINEQGSMVGNGGVIDVTFYAGCDGDTTRFNYPSNWLSKYAPQNVKQHMKVRYQGIDTPESFEGNVQAFGIPAKFYTTSHLESANKIQIQSVVDGSITETFGRLLGWVWADDELMQFLIVKKGYSKCAFESVDAMSYKGVTYTNWLYNIQLWAEKQKVGLHGEKDPYWDYENNKSTYTGELVGPEDN